MPAATPMLIGADTDRSIQQLILRGWLCAIGTRKVVYLSGPITTGRRFIEAVRNGVSGDDALVANLADLASAAERLRSTTASIVIDPSPLTVQDWTQADYMLLWTELIARHAAEVRFMPGWQFSLGCVGEFVHALRSEVATCELDGAPITEIDGRDSINAAIEEMDRLASQSDRIRALRDAIAETLSAG